MCEQSMIENLTVRLWNAWSVFLKQELLPSNIWKSSTQKSFQEQGQDKFCIHVEASDQRKLNLVHICFAIFYVKGIVGFKRLLSLSHLHPCSSCTVYITNWIEQKYDFIKCINGIIGYKQIGLDEGKIHWGNNVFIGKVQQAY